METNYDVLAMKKSDGERAHGMRYTKLALKGFRLTGNSKVSFSAKALEDRTIVCMHDCSLHQLIQSYHENGWKGLRSNTGRYSDLVISKDYYVLDALIESYPDVFE